MRPEAVFPVRTSTLIGMSLSNPFLSEGVQNHYSNHPRSNAFDKLTMGELSFQVTGISILANSNRGIPARARGTPKW